MKRKYIYIFGGIFFTSALFLLPACQKQQTEEKKEKVRLEFYNLKREVYEVL